MGLWTVIYSFIQKVVFEPNSVPGTAVAIWNTAVAKTDEGVCPGKHSFQVCTNTFSFSRSGFSMSAGRLLLKESWLNSFCKTVALTSPWPQKGQQASRPQAHCGSALLLEHWATHRTRASKPMCRPQHKMETWASCSKSRGIKLFSSSAVSFSTCHSALCILCNVLRL